MLKKLIVILILLITFKSTYSNNDLPYGNDILLILNYPCDSTENHYSSVDFLRNLYKPWFPNIIFYGPENQSMLTPLIIHITVIFFIKERWHAMNISEF